MNETISHRRDFAPRDFRVRVARNGRDLSGRLANHFQRSDDGILVQPARKKRRFVEPCDEALASIAASGMSRRSAAARSGTLAINCPGLLEYDFALNEVAARLDRLALDKVAGRPKNASRDSFESSNAASSLRAAA
jgi:hypothetical protein